MCDPITIGITAAVVGTGATMQARQSQKRAVSGRTDAAGKYAESVASAQKKALNPPAPKPTPEEAPKPALSPTPTDIEQAARKKATAQHRKKRAMVRRGMMSTIKTSPLGLGSGGNNDQNVVF